jgi:hypothetical protein
VKREYRELAICSALSVVLVTSAWAVEKKLKLDEVPAPVRAALEEKAKGGKIIDVDVNDDSGQQVYTSEIHIGKDEIDVRVAPDGKVLSVEPGNGPPASAPQTATNWVMGQYRYWLVGVAALLILVALWIGKKGDKATR